MTKPPPLAISVTTLIAAGPATVYELISDIPRMSEFSPETVRTAWLDGHRGPAVGARFKGTNAIGSTRWSTRPVVTAAEPGVRFAFRVPGRSGPLWSYDLEPVGGTDAAGTRVTESMSQTRPSPWLIRMMQRRAGVTDRAAHLRQGMITTLDRLRVAAVAQERDVATR